MPCVVLAAADVGATGYESRDELDGADAVKARIEAIRLQAGPLMNLGDVANQSVPKMMLVAPPRHGGAITVRSFIPHARPCLDRRARRGQRRDRVPAPRHARPAAVAVVPPGARKTLSVEHPSGETSCVVDVDAAGAVVAAGVLRTARKLMDGVVFA